MSKAFSLEPLVIQIQGRCPWLRCRCAFSAPKPRLLKQLQNIRILLSPPNIECRILNLEVKRENHPAVVTRTPPSARGRAAPDGYRHAADYPCPPVAKRRGRGMVNAGGLTVKVKKSGFGNHVTRTRNSKLPAGITSFYERLGWFARGLGEQHDACDHVRAAS